MRYDDIHRLALVAIPPQLYKDRGDTIDRRAGDRKIWIDGFRSGLAQAEVPQQKEDLRRGGRNEKRRLRTEYIRSNWSFFEAAHKKNWDKSSAEYKNLVVVIRRDFNYSPSTYAGDMMGPFMRMFEDLL